MIEKDLDKKQELDKLVTSSDRSNIAKRTASVISSDRSESITRELRSDWMYDRLKVQGDKNAL